MKERWDFLKESETSFGLFYPLHYTIVAFDSIERANAAHDDFVSDGFRDEDVASVSGPFMVDYLQSEEGITWFDKMRAGIARVIGTETGFLDDDVELARRGGAFLFVYTPDQEAVEHARALVQRLNPVFARRYHRAGIEKIAYPSEPSTL